MFWHRNNQKGTKTMLPCPFKQSITALKVKATPENVREMLELLGMYSSNFDKHTAYRNSKDRSKVATTSV